MLRVGIFSFSLVNDCCFLQRVAYIMKALNTMKKVEFTLLYLSLVDLYSFKDDAIKEIAKNDVLLFQRADVTGWRFYVLIEKILKENPNITIIHEIDDFLLENENGIRNRRLAQLYNNSCIICSTPYLADMVKLVSPLSKVYLYRTKLPYLDNYVYKRPSRHPTILHLGTATHSGDLRVLDKYLEELLINNSSSKIIFWGNDPPLSLMGFGKRIQRMPFISDYNKSLDKLYNTDCSFTINPYAYTRKNMAKTGIKFLEAGATFKLGLFSDLPEYKELVPVKELVVRNDSWGEAINYVMSLPYKRIKEIILALHEEVINKWTLTEKDILEYLKILEDCISISRGRSCY